MAWFIKCDSEPLSAFLRVVAFSPLATTQRCKSIQADTAAMWPINWFQEITILLNFPITAIALPYGPQSFSYVTHVLSVDSCKPWYPPSSPLPREHGCVVDFYEAPGTQTCDPSPSWPSHPIIASRFITQKRDPSPVVFGSRRKWVIDPFTFSSLVGLQRGTRPGGWERCNNGGGGVGGIEE